MAGGRRIRDYVSARVLFVDTHEPADPLWWIVGTQRSGTTWLADLVDPDQRRRVLFEPFHTAHSTFAREIGFTWGRYRPPGTTDPVLEAAVERLAAGRLRDAWVDGQNRRRLYRSRLVKDISATNLVPWLAARRPGDRVVLLLRHPFAIAWSLLNVPWSPGPESTRQLFADRDLRATLGDVHDLDTWIARSEEDDFVRQVLKWSMENALPVRAADAGTFTIVHYEDLVRDPAGSATRLGIAAPPDPSRPSRTDFRARAHALRDRPEELVTGWCAHVERDQVRVGMEIVEAFGLASRYGAEPWPCVSEC